MSDCKNATDSICPCGAFAHPSVIFNPPGRDVIAYRVGNYASFRHALLQSSPDEAELSSSVGNVTSQIWRPSGHGDLAAQMVEWWAYLADILTFYNERAATQAYLRTIAVHVTCRICGSEQAGAGQTAAGIRAGYGYEDRYHADFSSFVGDIIRNGRRAASL